MSISDSCFDLGTVLPLIAINPRTPGGGETLSLQILRLDVNSVLDRIS
ncbi:MAG: hypothetical protein KDB03_00145 [Planctomycetales bacterium]|nr:hypothetical protein [Planctomycetales bacterium]